MHCGIKTRFGLHWLRMRLFVGIALPPAASRSLQSAVDHTRSSHAAVSSALRWITPDSWHITLQFLGGVLPDRFACLVGQLAAVRFAPVRVELGALGCFNRPGVVFADVPANPALTALVRRVQAATAQCGCAAEARPFRPHVTLARAMRNRQARGPGGGNARPSSRIANLSPDQAFRAIAPRSRAAVPVIGFTAHEFLLYESLLGVDGAQYEVRARFALADSPDNGISEYGKIVP